MDRKKLRKEGESHKFMEKLFTRLKMTKHTTNEEKLADAKKLNPSSSSNSKPFILWNYAKLTRENMMQFSDQLQQLLEYLQEMKEVNFYTYDYPNRLNNKLEQEAMELKNLYRDVRAAAIDIDRLRKQRRMVKREKTITQKRLYKLRDEEMKELESIINVYAKPVFCKWESIKNTQKPEVLENFMNEVMGKHRAMEILHELIKRKLSNLKKQPSSNPFALKRNISSSNMGNKLKNQERATSNWNIVNSQEVVKVTPQPADRSPKPTTDRDIIRINRRKRQREMREDRRRQNSETTNNANNNNSENTCPGLDLQLVPIDGTGNDDLDEVMPSRATTAPIVATRSPVVNIEYTSDDDSVSLSSSDFIIENFVHGTNTDIQTDLQNEMRTVLHALFGEIRPIPQLGYSGRSRHNNSGNDLRSQRTASH